MLTWRKEWDQIHSAIEEEDIDLPPGRPRFLGYVMQQHNMRNNASGMTKGWSIFGSRVERAVADNIVNKLNPIDQVLDWDDGSYNLGKIPNLHSLIPYSQEARKPIFDCTSRDGLTGAHIAKARDSFELFEPLADTLIGLLP